jgi:hypothetical protein
MESKKGIIAIIGSGELTPSMVRVHKDLIQGLSPPVKAVFIDTPAGFQLNVDQISKRACDFFSKHLRQPMAVASFKSAECITPFEAEKTYQTLREADFILIGPGSPSYAVRQWLGTPIPEILTQRIENGACLVVASAATLTIGRFTLPVYEVYKVGEHLHWIEGINILGNFGLDIVLIPHWNNAEGGTHDTRYCYMGEPRFKALEALLPEKIPILGLDEHTACLIDLEKGEATIRGIGQGTLRYKGSDRTLEKGECYSLEDLGRAGSEGEWKGGKLASPSYDNTSSPEEGSFWDRIHALEEAFNLEMSEDDVQGATNVLLDLDRAIWEAQGDLENEEFISQAREILREWIVLLGLKIEQSPRDKKGLISPLVDALLEVREGFRKERQWEWADTIRERLLGEGIIVEDTQDGPKWRLGP